MYTTVSTKSIAHPLHILHPFHHLLMPHVIDILDKTIILLPERHPVSCRSESSSDVFALVASSHNNSHKVNDDWWWPDLSSELSDGPVNLEPAGWWWRLRPRNNNKHDHITIEGIKQAILASLSKAINYIQCIDFWWSLSINSMYWSESSYLGVVIIA